MNLVMKELTWPELQPWFSSAFTSQCISSHSFILFLEQFYVLKLLFVSNLNPLYFCAFCCAIQVLSLPLVDRRPAIDLIFPQSSSLLPFLSLLFTVYKKSQGVAKGQRPECQDFPKLDS